MHKDQVWFRNFQKQNKNPAHSYSILLNSTQYCSCYCRVSAVRVYHLTHHANKHAKCKNSHVSVRKLGYFSLCCCSFSIYGQQKLHQLYSPLESLRKCCEYKSTSTHSPFSLLYLNCTGTDWACFGRALTKPSRKKYLKN